MHVIIVPAHFGGSVGHGSMLEERRVQLKSDEQSRQEAMRRQQQQRQDRDSELAARSQEDVDGDEHLPSNNNNQLQPGGLSRKLAVHMLVVFVS